MTMVNGSRIYIRLHPQKSPAKLKRRVKFNLEAQTLGEVIVVYVQSAANRADILTKPVAAKIFDLLRDAILNVWRTSVNLHRWVSANMPVYRGMPAAAPVCR